MELTILERLKNALQFLDNFKDNHYGEAIDLINQAYEILDEVVEDLDKSYAKYNEHLTNRFKDTKVTEENENDWLGV
tara:strand:+ start:377 stop:607 length:231 start_codon:yes stop_codon:yes gene_type:complete